MNDQDKATPMSETNEQIIPRIIGNHDKVQIDLQFPKDRAVFNFILDCMKDARLSERTRIMEEGRKELPDRKMFIDFTFKHITSDDLAEDIFNWMRDQASLVLSSQRIEAERKAKEFAEWCGDNYNRVHDDDEVYWYDKNDTYQNNPLTTPDLYTLFEAEQNKKEDKA